MKFPEMYLSGGFDLDYKSETDMLKRSGCGCRCFSAAFVIPDNLYYSKRIVACQKAGEDKGIKIMLDSGAASLHAIQAATTQRGRLAEGKQVQNVETLQREMYARYITYVKDKLKKKKIEFYVTLDFAKNQPIIYAMQKQFARDGLCPMPVFHGDSDLTWLKKYADMGVNYIAIGTVPTRLSKKKRRYFLDAVFNEGEKLGLKYHGLATTRLSFLFRYPFKSVDSASWTKMAGYGCLLLPTEKGKMIPCHVSDRLKNGQSGGYQMMSPQTKKMVRDYIGKFGFDLKKMRNSSVEREIWNAFVFSNLEKCGMDLEDAEQRQVRWENML